MNGALAGLTNLAEAANTGDNIRPALHELCTNIVRHAYAGAPAAIDVEMKIASHIRQFNIRARDQGQHEFDMNRLSTPAVVEPSLCAMGLWLITLLMDVVDRRRTGDTNEWLPVKELATLYPIVESVHTNLMTTLRAVG